jgi:hypothetical protein
MADRMTIEIDIGGPVPRTLVAELVALIGDEGLCLDYDGCPFEAATEEELLALCRRNDRQGTLHLVEHEVAWGHLERLEAFLIKHGIAFDRWTDHKYEYDAELVQFRRGMKEPICRSSLQNKEPVVSVRDLDPVRQALIERQPERARRLLEDVLGPVIPALEPLSIVDDCRMLADQTRREIVFRSSSLGRSLSRCCFSCGISEAFHSAMSADCSSGRGFLPAARVAPA